MLIIHKRSFNFISFERFRCVRLFAVWKSKKRTNRESSSCNQPGALYLAYFGKSSNCWS